MPQPPQSTPPSTTAFSLSEVALRICLAEVLLALAMSADTSCPKQQVELDPRENSRRKVPSHNAKGERLQPQEIPAVQVYLALARVLLCLDTGITRQSWPTGTQEMPRTTLQTPRAKAYKLVSPPVSLICVSWRARSLRSTMTWPWLLNPYLHQDKGGSRLRYVCEP